MTLAADETDELRQTLMQRVPRSVVLVPNDRTKNEIVQEARSLGITTFDAAAIEESKAEFVTATGAAAVFANRYDGIDFPGDECRLLFLDGLPRTTNPQERFFVAKMGANALLQGRIQTRVVQAVGRCTRSLQDYSAVVVTGSELTDYLNSPVRLSFLHPELQAELDFGARQSTNVSITDLVENFDIFLRNDAAWEGVNRQILAKRDVASQATPSGVGQLQAVVTAEINYQKNLWQKHYEGAVENAGQVLAALTDSSLHGYRALWNYLAGAAAAYGEAALALQGQIERLEATLLKLGTKHEARFAQKEKAILDGLNSADTTQFETAHKDLGEMLGFDAGRHESDASPDPWWTSGKYCLVRGSFRGRPEIVARGRQGAPGEWTSEMDESEYRHHARHRGHRDSLGLGNTCEEGRGWRIPTSHRCRLVAAC